MNNNIRVTIFEDNHSLRDMLSELINDDSHFECVGAFPDCNNLFKDIDKTKPDVVLMDIGLPNINGIEAVMMLKERYPDLRILMQTVFEDDEKIFQSICAGASGYILKNTSPAVILQSIDETYKGGAPMSPPVAAKVLKMVQVPLNKAKNNSFNLTEREKDILSCLVKGMSYKLIAAHCDISFETVHSHIKNIYEKLHVHSKSEAVIKAINKNIV